MKLKPFLHIVLAVCLFACMVHEVAADKTEDFETGDFSRYPWYQFQLPPSVPSWEVNQSDAYNGLFSANLSGGFSGSSELSVDLECEMDGYMMFRFRFDTFEGSGDSFSFWIDDEKQDEWTSPVTEWTDAFFTVLPGLHTYTWKFSGSPPPFSSVYLDDIWFPEVYDDPPNPNPMTWETEPYRTSSNSIRMVATTASHPYGVMYYFDETSGNSGGVDSGWQESSIYENAGVSTEFSYSYQVRAESGIEVSTSNSVVSTVNPADTHYVDVNSTNPISPYLTWATAATEIQDAVDVATIDDSVLVTNGVYDTGASVMPGYAYACDNRVVITKDIIYCTLGQRARSNSN